MLKSKHFPPTGGASHGRGKAEHMKTSLRRFGAVLLTLTLALGLLSGCGAAPVSDDISGGASYEEDWGSAPAASQDASQSAGESDPDALPEGGSYTSA